MAKKSILRVSVPFVGKSDSTVEQTTMDHARFTEKRSMGYHNRRGNHHDKRVVVLEKKIIKHREKAAYHRTAVEGIMRDIELRELEFLDALTMPPAPKTTTVATQQKAEEPKEVAKAEVHTPLIDAKVEKKEEVPDASKTVVAKDNGAAKEAVAVA